MKVEEMQFTKTVGPGDQLTLFADVESSFGEMAKVRVRAESEGETVDLVICLNTLHHLEDPVPLFNEVARVLKEEGKFVMMDLRRDAPKALVISFNLLWRIIMREEKVRDGLWNSLKAALTVKECEEMLRRSNLPSWRIYPQAIEMWIESH